MKHILIILVSIFVISSCANSDSESYAKVEEAARRDAAKVVEAPEGSMQREHAVLSIKVRENSLREAGYDKAADIYIRTAHKILADSLQIITP